MRIPSHKLALYTTIYPSVLTYLPDWYHSVRLQTDQQFELWIGLDGLMPEAIEEALGSKVNARWIVAPSGSNPAQIRQMALSQIAAAGLDVVLVDSDDILYPSRVTGAREALVRSDVAACALAVVDQNLNYLDLEFNLDPVLRPSQVLPRNNIFGFSNSAYRWEVLERCLPIPSEAVLVDWYLATRAWLFGAELAFDRCIRMKYRQYGTNTARVRLPFFPDQILSDTALVRRHFQLVLAAGSHPHYLRGRWAQLLSVTRDVEQFERFIQDPAHLAAYAESLNRAVTQPIWWTSVAYSPLAHIWKQEQVLCRQ